MYLQLEFYYVENLLKLSLRILDYERSFETLKMSCKNKIQ